MKVKFAPLSSNEGLIDVNAPGQHRKGNVE
jgi:hypothetical protein